MKFLRHVILALIVVAPLLLADAGQAEAAAWHSPAGPYFWTMKPVCRDGVEVIMMRKFPDNPSEAQSVAPLYSAEFVAFHATAITGMPEPQRVFGPMKGYKEKDLGYGSVTESFDEKGFFWTDDVTGSYGYSYIYGVDKIVWYNEPLPVGATVVVQKRPGLSHFVGAVTDCWL